MAKTITRQALRDAIEAGLSRVYGEVSPSDRYGLRDVAETTDTVGTNFGIGCPATQAGLFDLEAGETTRPWVMRFATSYDRSLMRSGSVTATDYVLGETLTVVDDA